ncbi:MAG: hypothetical protein ACMUHB_05085 [Thermoplasmatota archaeon]
MRALSLSIALALLAPALIIQNSYPGSGSNGPFDPVSNPAEIYVEENITSDTFWGPESSPIIINRSISVSSGVTLWILPGTSVEFGKGSSLVINGTLNAGGEGAWIDIAPYGPSVKGSWEGLYLGPGSRTVLERINLTGANSSVSMFGPCEMVVRNSTFSFSNRSFVLDSGSIAQVYNSTMDHSSIQVKDDASVLRTFSHLSGLVVDHLGSPRGDVKVEIFDNEDIRRLSFIVNSTGEVPPLLFEGSSFIKGGRNETPGSYLLSISDSPFTHFVNYTFIFNGTVPERKVLRFTWAPELSSVPRRMNIFEDALAYHYSTILDRNGVGSVAVHFSSTSVTYNRTLRRLEFLYRNESVGFEVVNVTLDDGFDTRTYWIEVNITPVNDPFTMDFSENYLHPVEDTPYEVKVYLSDEDTPSSEILVWTDDPTNVSYDRDTTTLTLLYGDGTDPEFEIVVNATDGWTNRSRTLNVFFQPVYFPPYFKGGPADVELQEDTPFSVDLSPYMFDDDEGDEIVLSASVDDYEVFSVRVEGHTLIIEPYKDRFGQGSVSLVLRDNRDLSGYGLINVTVLPVDDEPVLSYPKVKEIDSGLYEFSVAYNDIDGNMPEEIYLEVSGHRHDLDLVPGDGLDPGIGLNYSKVIHIGPGRHSLIFRTVQGDFMVNVSLPDLLVEERVDVHYLEAFWSSLNVTVWTAGGGGSPTILTPELRPDPIGGLFPLGCIFKVQFGDLAPRRALASVVLDDFRSDTIPTSTMTYYLDGENWTSAGPGSFETSTGIYTILLQGVALNSTIGFWVELDGEFDSDGDGVKNFLDLFPDDPNEWNDTDGDGVGDNADPDDDDDGFDDVIEEEAGTDPRSSRSYPIDTDNDGVLDYLDPDDDGDGMPDEWEKAFNLDPLDPLDADLDPDGDGSTNLEEYLAGTDPLVDERTRSEGENLPVWIIIAIAVALMALLIGVLALLLKSKGGYEEEWKEDDEEWEIQGELDPEEALDCERCSEIFPVWLDKCPKCGWKNYLVEE